MPDHALDELLNQAIDTVLSGSAYEPSGSELDALVRIARALREIPAEHFQSRLKAELQRRVVMTPTAVTPYIAISEGPGLIEFLKRAFEADELRRSPSSGDFQAEVRIGDSILLIGSGRGGERIGAFHVYVPDCDAAYKRAIEAGATSMGEPSDRPYGERSGFVKDLAGNHWYIATRFASVVAPEGVGSVLPFLYPLKVRAFIDFVKRAFAAEEMGVFEESGRVMHAAVRIGDSVLEMGEPAGEAPSLPSRFVVYVEDSDAWYRRAISAGARSLEAPVDRPMVQDPFGYQWVLGTGVRMT